MSLKILQAHAPGFGDNLLYGEIPYLNHLAGHKTKISTLPAPNHNVAFRNEEIRKIVWECNPYVDGFIEEPPNCGNVFQDLQYIKLAKQIGPMKAVAQLHGYQSSARVPVIYYQPQLLKEWQDTTVCDPSSISQPIASEVFEEFVAWSTRWFDLGPKFVILKSKHSGPMGADTLVGKIKPHFVRDIFEYADILYSAKAVLMTESGGSSLSAALRDRGTFVCITTMSSNDRIFVYPDDVVTYYHTGRLTPDTHHYDIKDGI